MQIDEEGLVVVDRTARAASITGLTGAGAADNELKAAANTTPFGAANHLVGRDVTVTPSGGGTSQTLKIIANTGDTLTLETTWDTPPRGRRDLRHSDDLHRGGAQRLRARVALGLNYGSGTPVVTPETPLFNGTRGIRVGSNNASTADLSVHLSTPGAGTPITFTVNLDSLPSNATVADIAQRIRTAATAQGVTTAQFEVLTTGSDEIYLIDRAKAGAVATFTVSDVNGSTAAADLLLNVGGSAQDVDYASDQASEYVILLGIADSIIEGGPLHGDTPSAHLSLLQNTGSLPHIQFDANLRASGITGTGFWGPLALNITAGSITATSDVGVDVTFQSASLRELVGSLVDPSVAMIGNGPASTGPLNLSLTLMPQPGFAAISDSVGLTLNVTNVYDTNAVVAPTLVNNSSNAYKLLNAVEFLTVDGAAGRPAMAPPIISSSLSRGRRRTSTISCLAYPRAWVRSCSSATLSSSASTT